MRPCHGAPTYERCEQDPNDEQDLGDSWVLRPASPLIQFLLPLVHFRAEAIICQDVFVKEVCLRVDDWNVGFRRLLFRLCELNVSDRGRGNFVGCVSSRAQGRR